MKRFAVLFLAVMALSAFENKSHAFGLCSMERGDTYCWQRYGGFFWLTSTTFTGPLAVIMDGEVDFTNPEARNMVLAQADAIVSGSSETINESENIVRTLAQAHNVEERRMAEAIKSLGESGREITRETILESLK